MVEQFQAAIRRQYGFDLDARHLLLVGLRAARPRPGVSASNESPPSACAFLCLSFLPYNSYCEISQ